MLPLRRSVRSDSGQVAILMLNFLVVLLGIAAAAIDVGSWYRADRELQQTVDAAALAGAQELPEDPANGVFVAKAYADKNGGGVNLTDISLSTRVLDDDSIAVKGEQEAPGFFAKILGVDSVTVHASAKARTGVLSEPRWAAPIAVDERHPVLQAKAWGVDTDLELEKTGPGAFRLINIDGSRGGTSPGILADWINLGYEGYMPLGWYYSDPGAKFNSGHVRNALDNRLNTEMLFPVYRETSSGGANFEYEVVGWAGYVITSYEIQGSKKNKLYGYFSRVVWEGIGSESADTPDFGARAVSLVE
jgi:hypothetical protein